MPTTGKLDDPQFMVRNWQVPLNKPWDYNAAQNMLMLSQSLAGPGKARSPNHHCQIRRDRGKG